MTATQATRQNSHGHRRPAWCVRDHSADGPERIVHRGTNVRIEVPGAGGLPERIIAAHVIIREA